MVNLGLCKTARLQDTKSPENETSRPVTNTSEISRSGPNYQRPALLEEPFYTPITLQLITVTGHRSHVQVTVLSIYWIMLRASRHN